MYTSNPPSRVSSPNLLCIGCSSPISFILRLQALNKGNGLRYKPLNLKSRSSAAPLLTIPPNLMMINLRTRRFLPLHPLQKSIQSLTHRITHTTVTYLSFVEYHSGLLQLKVVFSNRSYLLKSRDSIETQEIHVHRRIHVSNSVVVSWLSVVYIR